MEITNLEFNPKAGETIEDAIRQAYYYSFENNVKVAFKFNGFQVKIKPIKT